MLQRAGTCGVGPLLTYTTDDSKLEALVRTAKENAGSVYCMLGVHSDNIKRANDRCAACCVLGCAWCGAAAGGRAGGRGGAFVRGRG